MERYTKSDVDAAFQLLIKTLGGRIAADFSDTGAYQLDHNGSSGGYNVERIERGGGVSQPLGAMRRNAREFCYAVNFAVLAMQEAKAVRTDRGNTQNTEKENQLAFRCDMSDDCSSQVTHIGAKGYLYCEFHARARRESGNERTRRMDAAELKALRNGEAVIRY